MKVTDQYGEVLGPNSDGEGVMVLDYSKTCWYCPGHCICATPRSPEDYKRIVDQRLVKKQIANIIDQYGLPLTDYGYRSLRP